MNVFLDFTQKFKTAAEKCWEIVFFFFLFFLGGEIARRVCRYPGGQKFYQKNSISHRFRYKCVFAFYAEIQDGHQKWWEKDLWEKLPNDSADTLGVKNILGAKTFI